MRQQEMAARLNVSFQLIQKYETGLVRIGAGRMTAIAGALGVSAAFFFDCGQSNKTMAPLADEAELIAFTATKEGMALNRAFRQITNSSLRGCVLALIRDIAKCQP